MTESKYLHLFICWDHSYILNLSMTLSDIVATVRVFFFFFWFNNLLYGMQGQTVVLTTKWTARSLCYIIPSLKEKAFGLYLMLRSLTVDLTFIFRFSFYFILFFFFLFFSFLFLEQLGLGFISHKTDHGTWENRVEGSRIKWRHIA